MKFKGLILLMMCLIRFNTLNAQAYQDDEKYRVGLKAGPVISTLKGNELTKSSLNYGFTGGLYFRYKLKGGFHYQTEINSTIRGARFNGNGNNGYNKFTLLYLDATQLLMKDLKKGDHTHCVVLGAQPSVMLQSWVYSPYFQLSPAARGVKLNGGDAFVVFGYQLNKRVIGIQSVIKIGLTNINRGLNMYDVLGNPLGPTSSGTGVIRNISWETSIAF